MYVEADELLSMAEEHGLDEQDVDIGAIIRLSMKQLRNEGPIEAELTRGQEISTPHHHHPRMVV